jgi:hypothetical protein
VLSNPLFYEGSVCFHAASHAATAMLNRCHAIGSDYFDAILECPLFLSSNRQAETGDVNAAIADAVKAIRALNDWGALTSISTRPIIDEGALFYGVSGFVIGITGVPVYDSAARTGDFGNVTVWLVPFKILFANRGPETLNMLVGIYPGPGSTSQHEDWHIDGIPGHYQDMVRDRLLGADPRYVIGFKQGFIKAMEQVRKDYRARNSGAQVAIEQLLLAAITSAVDPTTRAGTWHADPTVAGATYDVHI